MSGLYRRPGSANIWMRLHFQGRRIRKSTGTSDLEKARRVRAAALAAVRAQAEAADWAAHVKQHQLTSTSWLRRTHSRIVSKSRKRGWLGVMSLEELAGLMRASGGRCSITGLPFTRTLTPAAHGDPLAISLDRVDSKRGYTADNCRLVLLAVNVALREWGLDQFVQIAQAITERHNLVRKTNSDLSTDGASH